MKVYKVAALYIILSTVTFYTLHATDTADITVISDISKEGRVIIHPTSKNPCYYLPIVGGYKELGSLVKGEKKPNQKEIIHSLAVELAKQGYFVVNKNTPPPNIILVFYWGYINPDIVDLGAPTDPDSTSPTQTFLNQDQMLALVGGSTLKNLDLNFEKEEVMQAAEDDRYFLSVQAYDYTNYSKNHKKVILWHSKVSIPTANVDLGQMMPALIKAGGPLFGVETIKPKIISTPIMHEGKVEIGTPTVKEYGDSKALK